MSATRPDPAALVAAARLEGERSQQAFRALLDALARPGTVVDLAPVGLPAEVPAALVVPLALADVEISVAVLGDDHGRWGGLLADATGARPAPVGEADVVVALAPPRPADLRAARRGTAEEPDRGSRWSISCTGLHPAGRRGDVVVELDGPGVDGIDHLGVDGLPAGLVDTLAEVNADFPRGIDVWLSTPDGCLAGLPRSTRTRRLVGGVR
jgi:alpha-D-ribose 1-methylphosphonate 5-triphosphate synthase subunit PhnH